MLRDNLAGLIEPMRAAREPNPLALFTEQKKSSDDRPQDALKIPAPKGRNLTLTENAASPFHAEPRHESENDPLTFMICSSDDRELGNASNECNRDVGVEKVTVISGRNGGRSVVIRRRNACHRHSRRPADHDGTTRPL